MSTEIFDVNPYENHPELTQTEAKVLWEYAKLNQRLKIVSDLIDILSAFPPSTDLPEDDHADQATQPST